jgi:hypothetical protein
LAGEWVAAEWLQKGDSSAFILLPITSVRPSKPVAPQRQPRSDGILPSQEPKDHHSSAFILLPITSARPSNPVEPQNPETSGGCVEQGATHQNKAGWQKYGWLKMENCFHLFADHIFAS